MLLQLFFQIKSEIVFKSRYSDTFSPQWTPVRALNFGQCSLWKPIRTASYSVYANDRRQGIDLCKVIGIWSVTARLWLYIVFTGHWFENSSRQDWSKKFQTHRSVGNRPKTDDSISRREHERQEQRSASCSTWGFHSSGVIPWTPEK